MGKASVDAPSGNLSGLWREMGCGWGEEGGAEALDQGQERSMPLTTSRSRR